MKCIKCGYPDAYVGVNEVECLNIDCEYYSSSWFAENFGESGGGRECERFDVDVTYDVHGALDDTESFWDEDTVEIIIPDSID